ncbi:unnamed protein product [Ilex paraguariensis]|uniref:AP2/ERF domain-containing protein n=1 Tax=Ilex paraguariensis TaxID=185542 RepID=A0ABC8TIG3_9AQUA
MLSSSSQSQNMPQSSMSTCTDSQQYYFIDNFCANGWLNQKAQVMYPQDDHHQIKEVTGQTVNVDSSIFTAFMDSQIHQNPVPKLEDILGGDSTDTQDSSLTHIYFNDEQDLKTIAGFQALSTNSGSDVDDSASVGRTPITCGEFVGQSIESGNELAFSQCPTNALSLGVNTQSSQNAVVSIDSKKITDTFGGYDKEEKAARAYDLAALKYWGPTATTNFPVSNYTTELEEMKHATKQEFIASLRRKSSGFSRGASIYRGVTRHHQHGRWQARIGRVAGNKDLYLGTFAMEEEAAEAYDIAAIKFRGVNAVTNFEMSRYDVEAIVKSTLPIGGAAKRLKLSLEAEQKPIFSNNSQPQYSSSINFAAIPCGVPFDATAPLYNRDVFHHLPFNNAGASGTSSGSVSSMVAPMTLSPAEYFIWPHQSY